MSKSRLLLLSGIFLFFIFIIFSYLVHRNHFTKLDFNTTVRLQDRVPRRLDNIFSTFSDVGKVEIMSVILFIVLIFSRKLISSLVAVGLYIGFHLIEIYGKFFVSHPPPPQFMLRTKRIIDFPQFHVRLENSYPSGHSGRTIFISVLLITLIYKNKRLTPLIKMILVGVIIVFDITMLVSRVYLGEHWSSDVIGGTILGGALGLITSGMMIRKPQQIKIS